MARTGLSASEMRDAALDAALLLMREKGYGKTRMTDVARSLGVSHAALYGHFVDKAALLEGVVARWLAEAEEEMAEVMARPATPRERIANWFLARYRIKRQRALTDPEPFFAYDLASLEGTPFIAAHIARIRAEVAALLEAAGLGGDAEAALLLEAMAAFHHPSLIARYAYADRADLLLDVLEIVLRGLEESRIGPKSEVPTPQTAHGPDA